MCSEFNKKETEVDADIEQLLKSLKIDGFSTLASSPEIPSVPIPPAIHPQPSCSHKKKSRLPLLLGISILLACGCGVGVFLTKGVWWGVPSRIVHMYESPSIEKMTPPFIPSLQRTDPWSTNDLSCHLLPQGDLSENASWSSHLDILKAVSLRRKALEEMRQDIDTLVATCIHSPDFVTREALHRAIARFEVADVNLTHSLIPLILSKKSSLLTPQDQQKLNETLAVAGLGRGLEEYSKTVVQVAATKEFIEQFLAKLRTEREVCALAESLESVLQLLGGLRNNRLIPSFIDLEAKQKEAIEACQHSLEETLTQLPTTWYPRRCSQSERKAIVFLQGQFPQISSALFAKIDGMLTMKEGASRSVAFSDNNLGSDAFSSSSIHLFLAPDVHFANSEEKPEF